MVQKKKYIYMEVKERLQAGTTRRSRPSERESLMDKVSLSTERGQRVLLSREDKKWKWYFNMIIWWQVQWQEKNQLVSELVLE